jgi:hypothetical protein
MSSAAIKLKVFLFILLKGTATNYDYQVCRTGARGTELPPTLINLLFTYFFSIKFLYFLIMSSAAIKLKVFLFILLHVSEADLEGGVRGVRPLKFAKHMLYNVN